MLDNIVILLITLTPFELTYMTIVILLMNVFAPLIDYFVVGANKKRRLQRATV